MSHFLASLSFDLRSYFDKRLLALLDKFFFIDFLCLAAIVLKFSHKPYERKTTRYASLAGEKNPRVKRFSFAELLTREQAHCAPYRMTRVLTCTCGYTRPRALMQCRMRERKGNYCRYRTFTKSMLSPFEVLRHVGKNFAALYEN